MANTYGDEEPGELEFELDEQELEAASAGRDVTGTLRIQREVPESDDPPSPAGETSEDENEYGRRLFELSLREFESESELSRELDEVLDDMEREYLFGGLFNKIKSAAKGAISGIGKAASGLAGAALKGGLLKPLASAALSFVPGGSMALPLLQNMGFLGGGGGGGGAAPAMPQMPSMPNFGDLMGAAQGYAGQLAGGLPQQIPWQNLAGLFQNSFGQLGQLAQRFEGEISDPVQASHLANQAFQAAVQQTAPGATRRPRAKVRAGTRVIHLRPGEEIVIKVLPG